MLPNWMAARNFSPRPEIAAAKASSILADVGSGVLVSAKGSGDCCDKAGAVKVEAVGIVSAKQAAL
jgi:hypothetical protein